MKKREIDLGVTTDGGPFHADLELVLRSNLLMTANSGGGKSWAMRRMIEQAFPYVPQIVIDLEGEFSTLREKYDVVLVGKGGDTPADLRSAVLLAHRLLELGASAVIDLFELSKPLRVTWTAAFVQALVDAPKKLWRDLLIYVDEAHELAPEPGHGNERTDEKLCRSALIDLAAKGRKRGYGVVAATQRLGKLSKDFAAELKNVLIGQTFIDIDRERAAGALGIAKADKAKFFNEVKTVPPGRFFALGRALALEVTPVRIGPVQTEHPTPGRRQAAPPPPTKKILHLLPQLSDLPKEAEQKLATEKELRARIVELEKQAQSVRMGDPIKIVEKPVLQDAQLKQIEALAGKMAKLVDTLAQRQQTLVSELGDLRVVLARVVHGKTIVPSASFLKNVPETGISQRGPRQAFVPTSTDQPKPTETLTEHLPERSQKMLGALKQGEAMGLQQMPWRNVAVIAGVAPTSSTTSNRKGQLVRLGFITVHGKDVQLTDAGRAYPINVPMPPSDSDELLDFWKREIGTEKIAAILDVVVHQGPISNEALAAAVGMENSGTFSNYKGTLVQRGLIEKMGRDYVPTEVFRR